MTDEHNRSRQQSTSSTSLLPDDIDECLLEMPNEYIDFTQQDEIYSVVFIIEEQKLYLHKEVLSVWSPVFKSMFTSDFKERELKEIELPGKKMDDFVELLHCLYPPIKSITDSTVKQLLPLAEEYQIIEVKRKCEEFLLKMPPSMELLVTAQKYGLLKLLEICVLHVRKKPYNELVNDPYYKFIEPCNLISILGSRVQDLEERLSCVQKKIADRDSRLYGYINEFGSQYGNFCQDCKTRKVSDNCMSCLKMFREKVKAKVEEARIVRNQCPKIDL